MASSLADSNVRPHDRFFFSDGSLYLLVENSLYCVHRFLFEIHASMFPVRELETSRNKPYVLRDVKKSDFDHLLASLYPRTLWVEETEMTQDWISVLGLASKWGFESLRSRAISKIEQTLDSPIDMVTLGRQYSIPTFLLPGYAALCRSTAPLSDEEGFRLGMEDVLKIYRIRHELYGSGITPVSVEVALAKVTEAGLGDERPRQELEGEQASTWRDIGPIAASLTSAENEERGLGTLGPNVDSSRLDVASTDAVTLVSERSEQQHVDGHSPSDEPMSVTFGNEDDVPSSVFPGNVSDLNLKSSESPREGLRFIEELTHNNVDLVSAEVMRWVNTKDVQTLHQITLFIVEKATEAPNNPCVRLCRAMVKYTQTRHQFARLIVEKAAEEPGQSYACAQLCGLMINDTNAYGNATITSDGLLFSKYLGEIYQENLEAIATSVVDTGEDIARIRRLRLVEFIGAFTYNNFDLVSVEIMQWVNTKDIQTLRQITQLIVEKAIKAPEIPDPSGRDPFVRLCKAMVKYTQTLHQMTRLIVEKAMEEPHRIFACAQLCKTMVNDTNGSITADGSLFGEYLGEICQENLVGIAASVAADEHAARFRRLRLVEFIRTLAELKAVEMWAPTIINKWVAALLSDANDEEKVATLCMAMTRAGGLCTSRDLNSWLQRVKNVAEETNRPRVRKLLQDVTKDGQVDWVVAEDCTVQ